MAKVQNFSENLEKSFSRLGHDIGERLKLPESGARPEREIVKESVRSVAVPETGEAPLGGAPGEGSITITGTDQTFLPAYISANPTPAEVTRTVEQLIDLTFRTDIETAVRTAKRYPPFVENAFHDALTDKLLPELRKRGYLK